MHSGLCHHSSIFIKIVVSVKCDSIHCKIIYISHLRGCRQLSKIIHHIISVKPLFDCVPIFIRFLAGKIADLYNMRTFCPITATFIMIIKSIQHCSVDFHFIKIVYGCRRILTAIFFQAVKSVTFHEIFARSILDGSDLCFFRNGQKTVRSCCCTYRHTGNRQTQTKCQSCYFFIAAFRFHYLLLL